MSAVELAVIGGPQVGKSSLLWRYDKGEFNPNLLTSIGMDIINQTETLDDTTVNVRLYDTGGQEQYHSLAGVYLRSVDAVLLCFDPKDPDYASTLEGWLETADTFCPKALRFLVCTKCDQWGNTQDPVKDILRAVPRDSLVRKCKAHNFFITSAKTGFGVADAFKLMVQSVIEHSTSNSTSTQETKLDIRTDDSNQDNKKDSCC